MESSPPSIVCAGMTAAPLLLIAMLVAVPVASPTAPVARSNETVGFTLRRLRPVMLPTPCPAVIFTLIFAILCAKARLTAPACLAWLVTEANIRSLAL